MSTVPDITIGADPEFCCLSSDNVVEYSDNYTERGCIGADGGGRAFELRPDFSVDPLKVVSNIHKNFLQVAFKAPEIASMRYVAGSYVSQISQPLGGHIHFGNLPKRKIGLMCEWLDQYLASTCILIENRADGLRRRNAGYGGKSDHRTNDHGFEYRTLSSWLTSPYIAAGILCLAKTVVCEAIKVDKKPITRVNGNHIHQMNTDHIRSQFGDTWKEIAKMELYQAYKPQIDLLYTLIKANRSWFPNKTLKQAWGIIDLKTAKMPAKHNIGLEAIWSQVPTRV